MSIHPQSLRYKVIFVSNVNMMRLITGEIKMTGFPLDTRLCEAQPCFMSRGWDIIIEHPSFPEQPEGLICDKETFTFEEVNGIHRRKLYFD